MNVVPIPAWNDARVLPPVNSKNPVGTERSPYEVSLVSFVERFATSGQRCRILRGFLGFRKVLHASGVSSGFQWVGGSFVEDVEGREGRIPRDIDVVTFLDGASCSPPRFPSWLFDHDRVKSQLLVDCYWVEPAASETCRRRISTYWHSVWSHRRDLQWKGYLQIGLQPADDEAAEAVLDRKSREQSRAGFNV